MADLRRIRADPLLDSAARDSARVATLERHGVSAAELEALARDLARDPARALDDWREIERLSVQDSTHGPRTIRDEDKPQ